MKLEKETTLSGNNAGKVDTARAAFDRLFKK
jgi:hypothetical protein